MGATKIKFGVISSVVLAIWAILLVLQYKAEIRLRAENRLLQQQIDQMTPLAEENKRLSNQVAQIQNDSSSVDSQSAELQRLRAEADSRKGEIQKLQTEFAAVPTNSELSGLPASIRFVNVPKASWAFAGYATPEAALQTMLWATLQGDMTALRASLAPGEQRRRDQEDWKGKTESEIAAEGVQRLDKATGFQILKVEMLNDDTMHFSVYIDGFGEADQPKWMDMKKIGGEWKSDASEHHRDGH